VILDVSDDHTEAMVPKTPVLMIAAVLLTVSSALAQGPATTYPARPVKIIVGFAAGGGTDIVARLVAQKMQESFGQSFCREPAGWQQHARPRHRGKIGA
jgi:hypothetical protein